MAIVIGYLLLGGGVMAAIGLMAVSRRSRPHWWPGAERGRRQQWAQALVMTPLMLLLWPLLVLDGLSLRRRRPQVAPPRSIAPEDLRQPVSVTKLAEAVAAQPETEEAEWQAFLAMRQRGDAIWAFEQPAGEQPRTLYRATRGGDLPLTGYVLMRRGNPVAHLYTEFLHSDSLSRRPAGSPLASESLVSESPVEPPLGAATQREKCPQPDSADR